MDESGRPCHLLDGEVVECCIGGVERVDRNELLYDNGLIVRPAAGEHAIDLLQLVVIWNHLLPGLLEAGVQIFNFLDDFGKRLSTLHQGFCYRSQGNPRLGTIRGATGRYQ